MRKALNKFLIIILSIDLLFNSFYPLFIYPQPVSAQEDECALYGIGCPEPEPESAELPPAPEAETQPANVPPPETPQELEAGSTGGTETVSNESQTQNQSCGDIPNGGGWQGECGPNEYEGGYRRYSYVCDNGSLRISGSEACEVNLAPETAFLSPSPAVVETAPIVDSSSQTSALMDYYSQTEATFYPQTYNYTQVREENGGIVAQAETAMENANIAGCGPYSWEYCIPSTETFSDAAQNVTAPLVNWQEIQDQRKLEQEAEEAKKAAQARDEEYERLMKQQQQVWQDTDWEKYWAENKEAQAGQQAIEAVGGKIEGTPADFTFSLPSYAPAYTDLSSGNSGSGTSTISIPGVTTGSYSTAYNLGQPNISSEMLLEWASMGILPLAQKANDQIERTSKMKPVYDELGISQRTMDRVNMVGTSEINRFYQQGEINGYYPTGGTSSIPNYLRDKNLYPNVITPREILDDIKFYPELGSDEKNQARLDLLQMAIDREQKGVELGTDIAAWTAMTVVGGKAVEVGLKGVGAAAKPFINRVVKKGEAEVADAAKAVANALDNGEPIFAGATQSVDRKAGQQLATDVNPVLDDEFDKELVDQLSKAREIAKKVFRREGSDEEIKGIAESLLIADLPEGAVAEKTAAARKLIDFLKAGGELNKAPKDITRIWQRIRFIGNLNKEEAALLKSNPDALFGKLTYELSGEEQNASGIRIESFIDGANKRLQELENYVLEYHPDRPKAFPHEVSRDQVHVATGSQMDKLGDGSSAGFASGDQIIVANSIGNNTENETRVVLHECIHNCDYMVGFGSNGAKKLQKYISEDNARKVVEGITEFTTQFISDNQVVRKALNSSVIVKNFINNQEFKYVVYKPQVSAVHDQLIPAIMQKRKVSKDQANAIVIGAVRNGMWDELVKSAGGKDVVRAIFDTVPSVAGNFVTQISGRVITPLDISLATAGAAALAGGVVYFVQPSPETTPVPQSFWKIVPDVFAASEDKSLQGITVNSKTFELLVKQQLVKNAFSEDGEVDSDFVKDVLKMDVLKPQVQEVKGGYLLTTGKAGEVEVNLAKGRYTVSVDSLPGVDIEVPAIVDLSKGDITVPVKVKQGAGQVKKVTSRGGWDLAGVVYADSAEQNKIKVVVVSDKGNVLPWAGLNIKLEKVDQEKVINLNTGWNLMTLPGLPEAPLSAVTLLDQINARGGEAVAVSSLEDGAWKSYVKRGDKDYSDSADNFVIKPGKAYFVKTLKTVKFNFVGQNLVEPVKLKLNSGWNAIGLPKTSQSYKASELLGKTKGDLASRWESGLWDSLVLQKAQRYGEDFNIVNNRGYILRVEQESELSP